MGESRQPRPLFACGVSKSGTTWLQRVLDAHPEISCSGEGHFIEAFSIPLAQVMRTYGQKMSLVGDLVYEGRPCYAPVDQEVLDRIVRAFVMDRLLSRRPAKSVRWVGDKTPRYAHHLFRLRQLFPTARFVAIVRDPRDVSVSRLHFAVRSGRTDLVAHGTPARARFLHEGAVEWDASVSAMRAFANAFPGMLHCVRYEDMLDDPVGEARRIFEFLKVSTDATLLARLAETTSFEAMSGRKPGEEDPTAFFRNGVSGDWRRQLEPEAVTTVHDVCGALMAEYSYLESMDVPTLHERGLSHP